MTCSGAYASAWEFVAFWCAANLLTRVHDGGNLNPDLVDSQAQFRARGVRAGAGMVVYNVTAGAEGAVTAATDTRLTAALAGGTRSHWRDGDIYRIVPIDAIEIGAIEHALGVTAADVHGALAAQKACDCALSAWGLGLAKKLNIVEAAAFYTCSCSVKLSDDERSAYREWAGAQLELIRTGKIDLCEGGSGAEYPAFGAAEVAVTEFAAAKIIANRLSRSGL